MRVTFKHLQGQHDQSTHDPHKGGGSYKRNYSDKSMTQLGRIPAVGEWVNIRVYGGFQEGQVENYMAGIGSNRTSGRVGITGGWESQLDFVYPEVNKS